MKKNCVRDVVIRVTKDGYHVKYMERKKGGRYFAGQFNRHDNTIESVTQWVESNPKLFLIGIIIVD